MKAKRFVSLLIALTMVLALAPMTVTFAAGETSAASVTDLASSYVAAGAFTSNGLIDISAWSEANAVPANSLKKDNGLVYNSELKRYEAIFDSTSETYSYYNLPFTSSARREQIVKNNAFVNDGYSVETYFKLDATPNANKGILDAAYGGGFGVETGADGKLELYSRISNAYLKPDNGDYPGNSISIQPDTYYHVVMTVSGSQAVVYCDGEVVETYNTGGALYWPTSTDVLSNQYGVVFGGNYSKTTNTISARIDGSIVFGNVYNKVLAADDVKAAYDDIAGRKSLTKIDDLNTMLTVTLPERVKNDPNDTNLSGFLNEGWKLMSKAGLTDSEIELYLTKISSYERPNFQFPLTYNAAEMPGTANDGNSYLSAIAKYGFESNESKKVWSVTKVNGSDTQGFDAYRFSVRTTASPVPSSGTEIMSLDFSKDTIHNPVKLGDDSYVYETEYTVNQKGTTNTDLVFKGKDDAGIEKTFATLRIGKTSEASKPYKGKAFVIDQSKTQVQNALQGLNVTGSSENDAGDLIYVKAIMNFKNHTFSAWAVPRKTVGGTYSEIQASDENLLAKDVPFYDDTVTQLSGIGYELSRADGAALSTTCGIWFKNSSVAPEIYTVTGETDQNVLTATLVNGDKTVDGTFNQEKNTVTFEDVEPGTYTIQTTYTSGYKAAAAADTEVVVPSEKIKALNIHSMEIPATAFQVSGITDLGVKSVTLSNGETIIARGIFNEQHDTVTFADVPNGTYTITTEYEEYFVAADNADKTVTVNNGAVSGLKITSKKNAFSVVGTIDQYVQTVTLNQGGEVKYTGVVDHAANNVTFSNVLDGEYEIAATYEQNYSAKQDEAVSNVTVNGADIAAAQLMITSQPPADGVTLRLAVLSDLQYGRSGDYRGKFKMAMEELTKKVKRDGAPDVLMIPGDISHNSKDSEMKEFFTDFKAALADPVFANTKVLLLRGNHDAKDKDKIKGKEKTGGQFVASVRSYFDDQYEADSVTEVNGYQFVMVSQDTQASNDNHDSSYDYIHSPATIEWLAQAMNDASEVSGDKPIFVGMHPNTYDETVSAGKPDAKSGTIFGSFPIAGFKNEANASSDYWGTSELYAALKPYHNAVTFSGHSHWTVANEQSIHQRDFTSLNTGAVNNMEIENAWDESFQPKRFNSSNENESNGYYITVNTSQEVNVERMDFYRMHRDNNLDATLGADWNLRPADLDPTEPDTIKYSGNRDETAPTFLESAKVEVVDDENWTAQSAKIVWSNKLVDDDTGVNHYVVSLTKDGETEPVKQYTPSSYYWLGIDQPEENYWIAGDLEPDTKYQVKVTAYDQFYNASSNVLTKEFTTKPAAYQFDESVVTEENLNIVADQKKYGITAANTNTQLWTITRSVPTVVGVSGLRFTTRSTGTAFDLMKLTFAEDQTNNPSGKKFNKQKYVFETDVSLVNYTSDNIVSLKLNGKGSGADAQEQTFAQLIFKPTSKNSAGIYEGNAYCVDVDGNQVGNKTTVQLEAKAGGTPNQLFYIKAVVDLENQKYSLWLSPRKTAGGSYGEPLPTQLVSNADFNVSDITEFTSMGYHTTKTAGSNGVWIRNISVTDFSAPETTYTVTGTVDANVKSVKLVGNTNHEEVAGTINGTDVTFANVKADTYTIVAAYESGYTDKTGETRTVVVNGNVTGLSITSEAVSGPGEFSAVIVDGDLALNSMMAGNTTQVTVNMVNPKNETKTMMLFCAVYDSNNVLRAVTSTTKEVSAATDTMTATLQMPDAQTLPRNEIASAKIFVWDSGLVPYAWDIMGH